MSRNLENGYQKISSSEKNVPNPARGQPILETHDACTRPAILLIIRMGQPDAFGGHIQAKRAGQHVLPAHERVRHGDITHMYVYV